MICYHVLTLFPDMILEGLNTSIIGRALKEGQICLEAVNIRDFAGNRHGKVDDYSYGGGAGMIMQAEPVYQAWKAVRDRIGRPARVIYVTPQGRGFNQDMARELSCERDLIFLCGHYEGIDERVLEEIVTDYVSIGDYVLTGGELPAMVMIDAVSRLVPGVLSNEESARTESFSGDLLEYPQYSRPEVWRERKVPPVLLSGDHSRVEDWRQEYSVMRTRERRPDLYEKYRRAAQGREEKMRKKGGIKAVLIKSSVLEKRKEAAPFAEKFVELAKECGLRLLTVREGTALDYDSAGKEAGIRRSEVIAFADTREDVLSARESGLRVVYLSEAAKEGQEEELPCYKKISDFVEGMALIRRLSGRTK